MVPDEVEGVLAALRSNGIEVTALHSHMLMDAPHLLYAHFFAHGDPATPLAASAQPWTRSMQASSR